MTDLIIGAGEVGTSLGLVLEKAGHDVGYIDMNGVKNLHLENDAIHICFPYSDSFVDQVDKYLEVYSAKNIIVHSTVEVGTTRKLGSDIAYSFVRGRHPHLDEQMTVFPKHIGAVNKSMAEEAAHYLRQVGFEMVVHDEPESVELGKLWDTTYYGICIAATKFAKQIADHYKLDWDAIAAVNSTYNRGMYRTEQEHFVRPQLDPTPGAIGGHCVVPNAAILQKTFDHPLLTAIVDAK